MSAIAAVRHGRADDVMGRLVALVRPEFNTAVIRPDPDDPVLAGSPDAAIEVPEEDEVLAEHADVRRPGGRFLTAGEWLPVPAQELTAGGARAHAGQLRVERGGGSAVRCAGIHLPNLPRLPVR